MTFSRLESLDVRHLTTNQPFLAGVILLQQGKLVVTLNDDRLPTPKGNHTAAYRIKGMGGDQEAGETIWECAARRVREKLQLSQIELLSSPTTYFHEMDTGEIYPVSCIDNIAPFLFERQSNLYPYTPMRPGLPSGPYTYFGFFLARTQQPITHPGNAAGILFMPPEIWPRLLQQPTLANVLQQGATVLERSELPRQRQLWVHPWESFTLIASLIQRHPELSQH